MIENLRRRVKLISSLVLTFGASTVQAQTINAVYFGQTHVLKAADPYFGLVGNREALIKVHVTAPAAPASPAVTARLTLTGQTPVVLTLTGPATLPASIPDGLGVVQHSFANTFTGYIPAAWVKTGLQVTVNAGTASTAITNMKVSAPTKVIMTMTDVQYFSDTNSDYPAGTFAELEAKWPVAAGKRGAHDDPDNDGILNLVEYAIAGMDPTIPHANAGSLIGNLLSFPKRPGTSGLTYAIQETTDLGRSDDWTEVSGSLYVNNARTISYPLAPGPAPKNFLRRRVFPN